MNSATIILVIALNVVIVWCKPEQIHLSLGANPSEMMVTFTTSSKPKDSKVKYNKVGESSATIDTKVTHFKDKDYEAYIHRAKITGLQPGLTYEYKCGNDDKWSDVFRFKALTDKPDVPLRVAVIADLGLENGVSIPQLKHDVKDQLYDTIFHAGDISYNLNKNDGQIGDDYMNLIQPIAASLPYQVAPGNHERKRNFTHYINRFSMIDSKKNAMNNHFYSFDLGSAHFLFFSTELYYYSEFFTESHIKWQFEWIENDLKEANRPENRKTRPWIITIAHRPMYCIVAVDDDDCFHSESVTRKGRTGDNLQVVTQYGLEDLFYKYGVDIQFYGHKHIYERSFPIYNFNVTKGDNVYDNPKAPVHIITGVGGTTDRPDKLETVSDWTAVYARDYGFTRMNVQNKTHIFIEQFSVENNKVVDSFVIRKDSK